MSESIVAPWVIVMGSSLFSPRREMNGAANSVWDASNEPITIAARAL